MTGPALVERCGVCRVLIAPRARCHSSCRREVDDCHFTEVTSDGEGASVFRLYPEQQESRAVCRSDQQFIQTDQSASNKAIRWFHGGVQRRSEEHTSEL